MSGKRARMFRKKNYSHKKILALGVGLCLAYAPVAAESELLVGFFAPFTKPLGEAHEMQYGMGGGVKVTYRPVDYLNIFAQGEYLSMAMPGIDPISVLDASLGAGYHIKVSDRVSFDINASGGAYNAKALGKNISAFTAGLSVGFTYQLSPAIGVDATLSGTHYAAGSKPLMMVNAGIAPGITFNISQMFNKSANLDMELGGLDPVFPALYSWYEKNPFGKVVITNKEETAITDITVSFYQPQYMLHAKECMNIRKIEQGESAEVDLIAFFNEQMLELTEMSLTNSYVIVNYQRLGKKCTKTFSLDVPVYGRNNMSWDDDRRAAVFVSSKDPAAMHFAKFVTSIVREKKRPAVPINVQYAMGIFETLDKFGINYVVDPSSAFADNVGTASIDFLQFPYQTLMYKGGDCDDLSILVCSLFEAVGIRTAFITIPGHIFMAFDSGLTAEEGEEQLRNFENYIVLEDEVWIPLEITLSNEGFYKAYKYGAREWNRSYEEGTAAIYRMQDSWEIYPPISVPGAGVKFKMPSARQIALTFDKSVDQWSFGELYDVLRLKPAKLADVMETAEVAQTETVITEDPFATETLFEILSLSGQSIAALPTSGVRVVEKKDDENEPDPYDDLDDEEEDSDEEDGVVIPVVAVNVPGPEELGIVVTDGEAVVVGQTAEVAALAAVEAPAAESAEVAEAEPSAMAEPAGAVAIAPVEDAAESPASEAPVSDEPLPEEPAEVAEAPAPKESVEEEKKKPVAPLAAGAVAATVTLGGAAAGIYISKKKRV